MASINDRSYDIHVGLTDTYADMFQSHMESLGNQVLTADDGWEAWGEKPGTNGNDDNTIHVVIRVTDVAEAIATGFRLARKYRDILVPMQRQNALDLNDIILSVTESDNWDVVFVSIYQNEFKTQTAKFRSAEAIILP